MHSRRRFLAAAPLALLAGCATRFDQGGAAPRLQVQDLALNPRNGGLGVTASALQPGDSSCRRPTPCSRWASRC